MKKGKRVNSEDYYAFLLSLSLPMQKMLSFTGSCCEGEERRQSVCHEDPKQMEDAEEG